MNYRKKVDQGKDSSPQSSAALLSGALGALLGLEFGLYMAADEAQKNSTKMAMLADRFTPAQRHMADLFSALEIQLQGGHYEGVQKTCRMIHTLCRELYRQAVPAEHVFPLAARISYRLLLQIGDKLFDEGNSREALGFYMELLPTYPRDLALCKRIARMNYTLGLPGLSEAERYYRLALQLDPHDLEIYENIGRLLEVMPERQTDAPFIYREALQYCKSDLERIRFYVRLRELEAEDHEIPQRIGRLYQRMGMYMEARRYLEMAHGLNPTGWPALDLAYLAILLNDLQRAEKLLSETQHRREQDDEHFYTRCYLLALLREEEGRRVEARSYLEIISPGSKVYWPAVLLKVRLALQDEDLVGASTQLAKIPKSQLSKLGWEYLETCAHLAADWKKLNPRQSTIWDEKLKEEEPNYTLWKDIKKRSMGPGFWRKYEAIEILGQGPAGQVWLGRDRYRGHSVAIKQLAPFFLQDPVVLRRIQGLLRFRRELSTPRVASVFEECYYNGYFFYALEYIEGLTLREQNRRRSPLLIIEAAGLVVRICQALHDLYRTKKDVSHGNLKAENIFVLPDQSVKIVDFDYLWALEGTKVFPAGKLKEYQAFLPSFCHAAPERFEIRGKLDGLWSRRSTAGDNIEMAVHGVDQRADLFSLGVIFYELVTGFLPCGEPTLKNIITFHRSKSLPSPRLFNPTIPLDLEDIIMRLLARDPDHRFQSPLEVAEAIKKAKI